MTHPLPSSQRNLFGWANQHGAVRVGLAALVSSVLALSGTPASSEETTVLVVQALPESDVFIRWMEGINKKFEAGHPGVEVRLQTKSFDDLVRTLKLQLSGDTVPDVTQVNQGYASMGALVKANLLEDLTPYAEKFKWGSRQPSAQLDVNGRFSRDGKVFAEGPLYGLSATGGWVGLWMNRKVGQELGITTLPASLAELESDMQKAKAKGIVPMQFASDQPQYLWALLVQAQGHPDLILDIVKGGKDISLTSGPVINAAATFQKWSEEQYFTPSWIAYKSGETFGKFLNGEGLFSINGSWVLPLADTVNAQDFAMLTFPPAQPGSKPIAIATGNLPWSIPAKAAHKDLAADYIDLLTSADVANGWIGKGGVPVTLPDDIEHVLDAAKLQGPSRDAIAGWSTVLTKGIPAPFPDWATPTFLNALVSGAAELGAGRITPEQYAQTLEDDYAAFQSTKE